MGNIEKIIQAIDIQLIQKNKPYMLLAEANRLLTFTRLIADNKALKKNSRIRTDSSRLSNAKISKTMENPFIRKREGGKRKIG
jgi:uncharacterized cysteine cluster protein YcgN (CxxCxxCC family)